MAPRWSSGLRFEIGELTLIFFTPERAQFCSDASYVFELKFSGRRPVRWSFFVTGIGVGVRRVILARGELDKLEGPKYAARRAE